MSSAQSSSGALSVCLWLFLSHSLLNSSGLVELRTMTGRRSFYSNVHLLFKHYQFLMRKTRRVCENTMREISALLSFIDLLTVCVWTSWRRVWLLDSQWHEESCTCSAQTHTHLYILNTPAVFEPQWFCLVEMESSVFTVVLSAALWLTEQLVC